LTLVALFRGPCDANVPVAVRKALREVQASGAVSAAVADDLLLAATELITNAVNAGARTVEVLLETPPPYTKIDVTDDAPGEPRPGNPTAHDTSGRGLRIIEALAHEWGYRTTGDGKTVWARFTD
jgi:anti-sigma regulatory factor (Ser/Thr protein kinase)